MPDIPPGELAAMDGRAAIARDRLDAFEAAIRSIRTLGAKHVDDAQGLEATVQFLTGDEERITADELAAVACLAVTRLSSDAHLAQRLRDRAVRLLRDCPDAVTRTLRATGEEMRLACELCRGAAARFEVVADLLDKPLPWHKDPTCPACGGPGPADDCDCPDTREGA